MNISIVQPATRARRPEPHMPMFRVRVGSFIASVFCLLLVPGVVAVQTPSLTGFETQFENDLVIVRSAVLKAGQTLPNVESAHDTFWIALNQGSLSFISGNNRHTDIEFEAGDTRFFPSFDVSSVSNLGQSPVKIVLIALKPRALVGNACDCAGATAKFVCGCKGAQHLEYLWAVGLGNVTLAGTTLAAGESFRSAPERDDMLLVAVTGAQLQDDAAEAEQPIALQPGEATWIKSGRHQFRNVGAASARFVTVEF